MSDNVIRCSQISVHCVVNNPENICCGGPAYLGFDFNVREEQTAEMMTFVAFILESFEVPLENMYVSGTIDLEEDYIWTRDQIIEAIDAEAEYLKSEASRDYGSSFRR